MAAAQKQGLYLRWSQKAGNQIEIKLQWVQMLEHASNTVNKSCVKQDRTHAVGGSRVLEQYSALEFPYKRMYKEGRAEYVAEFHCIN